MWDQTRWLSRNIFMLQTDGQTLDLCISHVYHYVMYRVRPSRIHVVFFLNENIYCLLTYGTDIVTYHNRQKVVSEGIAPWWDYLKNNITGSNT